MTFKINCKMCHTYKKDFFIKGQLGYTIKDHVIEHLLSCKECHEDFKLYADENKFKFNVREIALDFVAENMNKRCSLTKDKLIELGFEKDIEARSKKWTLIAHRFDLTKLRNLPVMQDFLEEKMEVIDENFEDCVYAVNEWARFFAIKMCKNIDHLEICLSKSPEEGDNNEKA